MKKIAAYILLTVGIIGIIFFRNYGGISIPFPIFWWLLAIAVGSIGAYLSSTLKTKKQKQLLKALNHLKETGEKIKVHLDNCDFKTNDFLQEVNAESISRIQIYDSLYNSNRNYKTKNIYQTVIIYEYNSEKFISQTFPVEAETLKYYILSDNLNLYIDKIDRTNYFFELIK